MPLPAHPPCSVGPTGALSPKGAVYLPLSTGPGANVQKRSCECECMNEGSASVTGLPAKKSWLWLLETKGHLGYPGLTPPPLSDGNRSPEMDSAPPVTRRPAYRLATACDLSPRKGSKAGFPISALNISAQK